MLARDTANLRSKTKRQSLTPRRSPYFELIYPGVRLGYRRGRRFGKWVVRCRLGSSGQGSTLHERTFALADDEFAPDGEQVLDYWQARDKAREIYEHQSSVFDSTGSLDLREGAVTLDEVIDAYVSWFDTARERKDPHKAKRKLRGTLRTYILPQFSGRTVESLRTIELVEWHRWVAQTPQTGPPWNELDEEGQRRRKDTANRVLKTLRAVLNRGRKLGLVTCDSSAWDAVESFHGVGRRRERFLAPDEAAQLLEACPDASFRELVQLGLWTGFRVSELIGLKVSDFEPAHQGQLKVVLAKTGRPHIQPTGALYPQAATFLERLVDGRTPDAPLLTTDDGRAWTYKLVDPQFRSTRKRASLDDQVVFHTLRHTAVSWLVQAGIAYPVIANYIGHTNTNMIERHYGHLSPGFVRESLRDAKLPTL